MPQQRRSLRAVALLARRPLIVAVVAASLLAPAVTAHAEPSLAEIERQIAKDAGALEAVVEDYNAINEKLKATRAAIARHTARLAPLKQDLDQASSRVGEMAAIAYKGGAVMEFSAVLASGSSTEMFDRITTLNHLSRRQQGEVARATQTKAAYDGETARLARYQAAQSKHMAELAGKRTTIEADIVRLQELKRKAQARIAASQSTSRSSTATSSGTTGTAPKVSGAAGKAVNYAYGALGTPYKWGAEGPGGYDCSGLTLAAWRAAGVSLPHNARMQYNALPHIGRSSLKPGDLVFYNNLGHVGLYVGSNKIIHAPTFGDVVRLANVDVMKPYGYARPR